MRGVVGKVVVETEATAQSSVVVRLLAFGSTAGKVRTFTLEAAGGGTLKGGLGKESAPGGAGRGRGGAPRPEPPPPGPHARSHLRALGARARVRRVGWAEVPGPRAGRGGRAASPERGGRRRAPQGAGAQGRGGLLVPRAPLHRSRRRRDRREWYRPAVGDEPRAHGYRACDPNLKCS